MANAPQGRAAAGAGLVVGAGGGGAGRRICHYPAMAVAGSDCPMAPLTPMGARVLFGSLAGQTIQPWPYDFSRKVKSTDSDVRDLHVQPSDDSAFQP